MRRLILEILAAAALLPGQAEEMKNRFGSRSAYLAAERILEKQNAPGVSLWRSDPFPVEPGKRYAGRMTLEILSRTPGAMASFRLVGLNREGRETGGTAEMNPSYQRLYGSGRSREAERILAAEYAELVDECRHTVHHCLQCCRIGIHLFIACHARRDRLLDTSAQEGRARDDCKSDRRPVMFHKGEGNRMSLKFMIKKSGKNQICQ